MDNESVGELCISNVQVVCLILSGAGLWGMLVAAIHSACRRYVFSPSAMPHFVFRGISRRCIGGKEIEHDLRGQLSRLLLLSDKPWRDGGSGNAADRV